MIDYKKRFVEVDEIIKYLPKKEFSKIPSNLIDLIEKNKDSKYIWKYDNNKKLEVWMFLNFFFSLYENKSGL